MDEIAIISAPRSGTNYFCDVLTNFHEVMANGEIFNKGNLSGPELYPDATRKLAKKFGLITDSTIDPELQVAIHVDPLRTINVLREVASELGHKYLVYKIFDGNIPRSLIPQILGRDNVHVVFLVRQHLARYISLVTASHTQQWGSFDTTEMKITLDVENLLLECFQIEKWFAECLSAAKSRTILSYESHINHPEWVVIENFCLAMRSHDIDLQFPMFLRSSRFQKQNKSESVLNNIKNLGEIVERLLERKQIGRVFGKPLLNNEVIAGYETQKQFLEGLWQREGIAHKMPGKKAALVSYFRRIVPSISLRSLKRLSGDKNMVQDAGNWRTTGSAEEAYHRPTGRNILGFEEKEYNSVKYFVRTGKGRVCVFLSTPDSYGEMQPHDFLNIAIATSHTCILVLSSLATHATSMETDGHRAILKAVGELVRHYHGSMKDDVPLHIIGGGEGGISALFLLAEIGFGNILVNSPRTTHRSVSLDTTSEVARSASRGGNRVGTENLNEILVDTLTEMATGFDPRKSSVAIVCRVDEEYHLLNNISKIFDATNKSTIDRRLYPVVGDYSSKHAFIEACQHLLAVGECSSYLNSLCVSLAFRIQGLLPLLSRNTVAALPTLHFEKSVHSFCGDSLESLVSLIRNYVEVQVEIHELEDAYFIRLPPVSDCEFTAYIHYEGYEHQYFSWSSNRDLEIKKTENSDARAITVFVRNNLVGTFYVYIDGSDAFKKAAVLTSPIVNATTEP